MAIAGRAHQRRLRVPGDFVRRSVRFVRASPAAFGRGHPLRRRDPAAAPAARQPLDAALRGRPRPHAWGHEAGTVGRRTLHRRSCGAVRVREPVRVNAVRTAHPRGRGGPTAFGVGALAARAVDCPRAIARPRAFPRGGASGRSKRLAGCFARLAACKPVATTSGMLAANRARQSRAGATNPARRATPPATARHAVHSTRMRLLNDSSALAAALASARAPRRDRASQAPHPRRLRAPRRRARHRSAPLAARARGARDASRDRHRRLAGHARLRQDPRRRAARRRARQGGQLRGEPARRAAAPHRRAARRRARVVRGARQAPDGDRRDRRLREARGDHHLRAGGRHRASRSSARPATSRRRSCRPTRATRRRSTCCTRRCRRSGCAPRRAPIRP